MKQTDNYQLNQWELTDRVMMEDFNRDNQKIDGALAALPRIAVGEYTGSGENGAEYPNTLEFDFQPKLIILAGKGAYMARNYTLMIRGQESYAHFSSTGGSAHGVCTWTDKGVSWYTDESVEGQFNSGKYVYFAIG